MGIKLTDANSLEWGNASFRISIIDGKNGNYTNIVDLNH